MDYAKLVKSLIAEVKKGGQYARIPNPFKIFALVAMIPVAVLFVVSVVAYWVTLFFYKMISAPAEYLHQWLKGQKDDVQHATQAVMYFVCLPTIFSLQILLSLSAISFYIQWFFMMVWGYLLSLGAVKWQPFLNEAKFDDADDACAFAPSDTVAIVYSCVALGVLAVWLVMTILGDHIEFKTYKDMLGYFKAVNIFRWVYLAVVMVVNPILFKRSSK